MLVSWSENIACNELAVFIGWTLNITLFSEIPFVFFLAFLGIGLITNRYVTEKTIRQMEMVRDSLKEYKSESVIHETELMYINRPSEVTKRVIERKIDLVEPIEPPKRIKVKKMETK